ncbi:hypothetical protein HCN44_009751 [Aphidius gifuensis]|uniref:Thioredoxin domain-containing protein n=1 Tax=Aphidius gifuensis TaxID=684658 RepID=A0A834Y2Y2_APHGI|nr:thioredoxin-like [Aphidius gifuensis]KAF7998353.1 hypothetical protein HCN44_009751 [Aphidius gifuensis]
MVQVIEGLPSLEKIIAEAGDKLIVIDFFATWCGPCKMIAPKYEELSKENTNVVFLKVDVDDNEEIAIKYEISSMPTFVFIKNNQVVHQFAGASLDKLKDSIQKYQ